ARGALHRRPARAPAGHDGVAAVEHHAQAVDVVADEAVAEGAGSGGVGGQHAADGTLAAGGGGGGAPAGAGQGRGQGGAGDGWTTPGWTRTVSSPTSRMARKCRLRSTMSPSPSASPATPVPAPRGTRASSCSPA